MRVHPLILFIVLSLAVTACSRYSFTLNDNTLYTPPELLQDMEIADANLHSCIEQHIADREIRRASQLQRLICSEAGISNLQGLASFANIETLGLAGNTLQDIESIFQLTELRSLDLRDNPDLDCSQAERLSSLVDKDLRLPSHCQPDDA